MNSLIETLNLWGGRIPDFAWPMLWQSSLLIAVLFAFDFAVRRRVRAAVRYALWLVVLLKLLLPPTLALPTSLAWWVRPAATPPKPETPTTAFVVTYGDFVPANFPTPAPPVFVPAQRPSLSGAGRTAATWAMVGVGLLLWLVARWRKVGADVRQAMVAPESLNQVLDQSRHCIKLPRRVRLLVTKRAMSPAVCGLFRPVILLPQSLVERLTPSQLRAVLLHELVHLRRGDVWVNCLQALLQIFYWWHPLLWLANARIRRVREEAVDDAVMLALRDDAETYAPTLLEVAKLAFNHPLASLGLVGIMESRSALRQRIERLVDFRPPRKAGLTVVSSLCVLAFAALAVPMEQAPATNANQISVEAQSAVITTLGSTNSLDRTKEAIARKQKVKATMKITDGRILMEEGKLDEAEVTFQEAIMLDPENRAALFYLNRVKEARYNNAERAATSATPVSAQKQSESTNPPPVELSSTNEEVKLRMIVLNKSVAGDAAERRKLAEDIIAKVKGGAAFSEIASVYSEDRQRREGGDWGWVQKYDRAGALVLRKELADVAFSLKPREVSGVIETPEAIYLMLVEDKRPAHGKALRAQDRRSLPHALEPVQSDRGPNIEETKHATASSPTSRATTNFTGAFDLSGTKLESAVQYDYTTGIATVTNGGLLRYNGGTLTADSISFDSTAKTITAEGNVSGTSDVNPNLRWSANRIKLSTDNRTVTAKGSKLWTAVDFEAKPASGVNAIEMPSAVTTNEPANGPSSTPDQSRLETLTNKVPVLGDLPFIGKFFRSSSNSSYPGPFGASKSPTQSTERPGLAAGPAAPLPGSSSFEQLQTRVFSVNPNAFYKSLESVNPSARTNINAALHDFLVSLGLDMSPPKTLFFHERNGQLLVRTTKQDLDVIEAAVEVLSHVAPQINIKVRFVEIIKGDARALGFDWYLGNFLLSKGAATNSVPEVPPQFHGILTDPQFRVILRALEQREGTDILTAPEITTVSGRQAQIQVAELKTIVTGINPQSQPSAIGSTNSIYQTQAMPFGPTLDVIPFLAADGYTINMTVIPTVTEFLGYDDPPAFGPTNSTAGPEKTVLPLSRFRVSQMTVTANVRDGQTLVLIGTVTTEVLKKPDGSTETKDVSSTQKKQLIVFVTPTLIDPTGNRIHRDDEPATGTK